VLKLHFNTLSPKYCVKNSESAIADKLSEPDAFFRAEKKVGFHQMSEQLCRKADFIQDFAGMC